MMMIDDGRGGGAPEVMTSSSIYFENANANHKFLKITVLESSMKTSK